MPSLRKFSVVEGDWDSFLFKRVRKEDYGRVLEHFRSVFMADEPTCKLLGRSDLFVEQMDLVHRALLDHDLSFFAHDKETGELAAVAISFRESKDSMKVFDDLLEYSNLDPRTDVMLNETDFPEEKRDNLYKQYGIEEYAEIFAVSVDPKFRRRGLSLELFKRSLVFLQSMEFKIVTCIFTSQLTRRLSTRLGFKEFHKIDYKKLKNRKGELVFRPDQLNSEHFASVGIKLLY